MPKQTKHVQPVYPAEALAQGIRGIVILDVMIDAQGKVASTSVLRSVPGLDEAAIAAARQWEYEPTKVAGKPVSVRVTVPITFSLALPRLARQAGVPGAAPGSGARFPAGRRRPGTAAAEVTLEPDGRIGDARLVAGEAPWSDALLSALKTWRFASPPDDAVVSFRVEAEFVRGERVRIPTRSSSRPRACSAATAGAARLPRLRPAPRPRRPAGGSRPRSPRLRHAVRADTALGHAAPSSAPAAGDARAHARPSTPAPSTPARARLRTPASPAAPAPAPTAEAKPPAQRTPTDRPRPTPRRPPAARRGAHGAPPPAPPEPESGISAVRDVTLEPGVPELARGRRPVAPADRAHERVDGRGRGLVLGRRGGNAALQTAAGPDILRYAAEQTVTSWVFRRTRADRAYLVAVFTYDADKASAVVRPQAPSNASPAASDVPTATPPSTTPPSPAPQPPPQELSL